MRESVLGFNLAIILAVQVILGESLIGDNPSIISIIYEQKSANEINTTCVISGEGLQSAAVWFLDYSEDTGYRPQSNDSNFKCTKDLNTGWCKDMVKDIWRIENSKNSKLRPISDPLWEEFSTNFNTQFNATTEPEQTTVFSMRNTNFSLNWCEKSDCYKLGINVCKQDAIEFGKYGDQKNASETDCSSWNITNTTLIHPLKDYNWQIYSIDVKFTSVQLKDENGPIFNYRSFGDIEDANTSLVPSHNTKIQSYKFFTTNKINPTTKFSFKLKNGEDKFCIAISHRMCKTCQLKLNLRDQSEKILFKTETYEMQADDWTELKFFSEVRFPTKKGKLKVGTTSNMNSKKNSDIQNVVLQIETLNEPNKVSPFWAIKSMRRCFEKEQRQYSFLSPKPEIQCSLLRFPEARPDQLFLDTHIRKPLENFTYEVLDDYSVHFKFDSHTMEKCVVYYLTRGSKKIVNSTKFLVPKECPSEPTHWCATLTGLTSDTKYDMKVAVVILKTIYYETDLFTIKTTNFVNLPVQNIKYNWENEGLILNWDRPQVISVPINNYEIHISDSALNKLLRYEYVPMDTKYLPVEGRMYTHKVYNLPVVDFYKVTIGLNTRSRESTIEVRSGRIKKPTLKGDLNISQCHETSCVVQLPAVENIADANQLFFVITELNSEKAFNYTNSIYLEIFEQTGPTIFASKKWIAKKETMQNHSRLLVLGDGTFNPEILNKPLEKEVQYRLTVVLENSYDSWKDYNAYYIDFELGGISSQTNIIIGVSVFFVIILVGCVVAVFVIRKKRKRKTRTTTLKDETRRLSSKNRYGSHPPSLNHLSLSSAIKLTSPTQRPSPADEDEDHVYDIIPANKPTSNDYDEVYKHTVQTSSSGRAGKKQNVEAREMSYMDMTMQAKTQKNISKSSDSYYINKEIEMRKLPMPPSQRSMQTYINQQDLGQSSEAPYMDMNKLDQSTLNTTDYLEVIG